MSQWVTIINGTAGGGRCKQHAPAVLQHLRDAGFDLDVQWTEHPGHAIDLTHSAFANGARKFLCIGGDGTTYEVINGLFPSANDDDDVSLGILPLGTGNSFLRDFDITDTQGALDAVKQQRSRRCDVIRVRHREGTLHYLNLLSIGFSASVGTLTNQRLKPLGQAGYALAVVARIARLAHPVFPTRLDGGTEDRRPCVLLSFSNSRYTGGTMMMAPDADTADGRVDVIRIGPVGRRKLLTAFPRIYRGTHVEMPDNEAQTARLVEFDLPKPVDVMVDGEIATLHLESLEVLPNALEVLV